jgi:hypothetical protein
VSRPEIPFELRLSTSRKAEPVDPIERRGLVALRQRGVVEDRIDEVVNLATESQDGLPDVHELGGLGADDMNAQRLAALTVENELQEASAVAENLGGPSFVSCSSVFPTIDMPGTV